ncbi:MAG: NAD(P)-dependent alcohol dehydrogenase [Acidimicrobiia bacterium]|nr:NAD(P)-dependent alcohol dehydrogenase [Acidimicrobiia bacterium]
MQAIVQEEFGAPADVLELGEVTRPVPGDNEVLVRIRAAGVHIGDWLVVNGLPYLIRAMGYGFRHPKERVPGTELAGTVEAVGTGVTRFQPGDEVFGWGTGGFAEYATIAEDALASKPANVSFEQAAAVPISGFTALQGLRDKGEVQPTDKVLIIGASGGVGSLAVQIAKSYGADVTGVGSTRNLELIRALGADHVIDYTREKIAAGGRKYDLILDTAGNRSLSELRRALTPTGRLIIVGGSGGRWLMGSGRSARAAMVSPFVGQRLTAFISAPNQDDLAVLQGLLETGDVIPAIDQTFALSETAQALDHVGGRHTRGKTVITM